MSRPLSPLFSKITLGWLNPILLTLSSVILLTLSFPNFDGFYLAFIALVPLFIVIERESFFRSLICLQIFVLLFYGYFMWWVKVFHPFALPGVLFYLCIIYILPFSLYRLLRKKYKSIYDPILLAVIFTIFEYLRGLGFPRFPYGIIAYTQYSFLPFIQISDFTGFLGVSFLLYLTNSFLAHSLGQIDYLESKIRKTFPSIKGIFSFILFNRIWVLLLLLSLNLIYGIIRLQQQDKYWPEPNAISTQQSSNSDSSTTTPDSPFKVTLIQPWFDYNISTDRFEILTKKLFRLTQNSLQDLPSPHKNLPPPPPPLNETEQQPPPNLEATPDLVIWPESAIDTFYQYDLENYVLKQQPQQPQQPQERPYTKSMYDFLKGLGAEYNTTLLAGSFALTPLTKEVPIAPPQDAPASEQSKPPEFQTVVTGYERYNAALLINPKGRVIEWSGKTYLVPFAEYFPFPYLLEKFPTIKKILQDAQAAQFTPYRDTKLFFQKNTPFSVLICYEDTFSDLSRTFTLAGARFLVIITNDAWSYSDRSQNIHYAFSFFRAIENRRPILRAGNAGVTGLIDPLGRAHHVLPSFTEAYTTFSFTPQSDLTFYSSFGDWFVILLILFIFLLATPLVISNWFRPPFLKALQLLKKYLPKKTP